MRRSPQKQHSQDESRHLLTPQSSEDQVDDKFTRKAARKFRCASTEVYEHPVRQNDNNSDTDFSYLTKSVDSAGTRSRALFRQRRITEHDLQSDSCATDVRVTQSKLGESYSRVRIKQAADHPDDFSSNDATKSPIPRTQLIDPEGNIVGPGTRRQLPSVPGEKQRTARQPSVGSRALSETNSSYRQKVRALQWNVRDFRSDSDEERARKSTSPMYFTFEHKYSSDVTLPLPTGRECNISDNIYKSRVSRVPIEVNAIELTQIDSKRTDLTDAADYKSQYKEKFRVKTNLGDTSAPVHYTALKDTGCDSDRKKTVAFDVKTDERISDTSFTTQLALMSGELVKPEQLLQHDGNFLSVDPRNPRATAIDRQSRLHNQSSTETSGLGETIASNFSSQESVLNENGSRSTCIARPSTCEDLGIDLSEDTTNSLHGGNNTFGTKTIDSDNIIYHANKQRKSSNLQYIATEGIHTEPIIQTAYSHLASGVSSNIISQEGSEKEAAECEMKQLVEIKLPTDSFKVGVYKTPIDFRGDDVKKPESLRVQSAMLGPNFDDLFRQSQTLTAQQTVGLRLDQIDHEWNRQQKRSSSMRSRSSQGSFRSRSGSKKRFLSERTSQWMKWGADRRASYRKKIEKLANQPQAPRASTPVKKARHEGLIFVHPDLEHKYITEEEINYIKRQRHERMQAYIVTDKKKRKRTNHHDHYGLHNLAPGDLMTLSRFWEHKMFVRSRYMSVLLSITATILLVIGLCISPWVVYPSPEQSTRTRSIPALDIKEGLWSKCVPHWRGTSIEKICGSSGLQRGWQKGVIGLMIFSASVGFGAAILAICGVCTSPLPKKIYFFHSAGEIFFVCALSSTIALIIYAVAMSTDSTFASYSFGSGFGLGWAGTAFFYAAAFCMSLDELVRESAQNRCCRYIFWRSRTSEPENTHPV
ncbi:hypothetical protein DPMN_119116 [Dreissena polymorpha]|uniref:Uncharacterized protein n=1 Tax=Dreissena polymorpha TaxID=45954 RepID=A0A9D4GPC4_DREPO|nr:hypothetical protein DPMN_119116 [Dreissena polymorpha]